MRSRAGSGAPSTVTRSAAVTLSAGEAITVPLTATRPAAIQASASRREREPGARDHLGDALAAVRLGRGSSLLRAMAAFIDKTGLIAEFAPERAVAPAFFHGCRLRGSPRRRRGRRGAGRLRDRARRRGDRARRQPHPARPRPDRPCRDAGDPRGRRGARLRAAHRLRPLRHARALRHVRGRDLVRAHPPALLRRRRPQGRRGRERRAVLRRRRPAITGPRSMAASARREAARLLREFFAARR